MAYKVGIIGYGWAATAHADAINGTSQGTVTAVYSSRPLDDAEVSARHGGLIKTYTNLDEMLASDIDVVSITSYPAQHRAQAEAAAKAGKHIILEKPMALTWDDCSAIAAAVKAAGVRACVCFEIRFISQFLTTSKLLDSGMIGEIHYGEVDYYHGIGPWYGQYRWNTTLENGGSSLLSAGCHALDALLLCMGNEVEEVSAYETQSKHEIFQKYEYKTTTVALLKFKNGSVGSIVSSPTTSTPTSSAAKAACSTTSSTPRSSPCATRNGRNCPSLLPTLAMSLITPTRISSRPSSMRSTEAKTWRAPASPNRSSPSACSSPATSRPARAGR